MSIPKLTIRQRQILDYIRQCIDAYGYPPTRAEISAHFGFRSANSAECHLRALQQKGVIQLPSGLSRGIVLLPPAQTRPEQGLPLVGQVAAGSPILAEQNIESYHSRAGRLFSRKPDYLLRVRGDSMRDIGILDGDLIAVKRQPEARNNQIVVARVDDEVTVKRYRKVRNKVYLSPENPEYEVLEVDISRQPFVIEGICVGVVRSKMDQR